MTCAVTSVSSVPLWFIRPPEAPSVARESQGFYREWKLQRHRGTETSTHRPRVVRPVAINQMEIRIDPGASGFTGNSQNNPRNTRANAMLRKVKRLVPGIEHTDLHDIV